MNDLAVVIMTVFGEGILFFLGWLIYDAMDRKKIWAIEKNTNTGKVRIMRRRPSHEAYILKAGKQSVLVKLEERYIFGHSNRGPVFIVDSDVGFVQREGVAPVPIIEKTPTKWT